MEHSLIQRKFYVQDGVWYMHKYKSKQIESPKDDMEIFQKENLAELLSVIQLVIYSSLSQQKMAHWTRVQSISRKLDSQK